MNIGQAAAASGISAKMIRHYETIGLIEAAERTGSGYRVYTQKDVETLRFIRRSRDLGFQVEQIKELLTLWRDRNRASADVKKVALGHVEELEAKMRQLQEMADTLRYLAKTATGTTAPIARSFTSSQKTAWKAANARLHAKVNCCTVKFKVCK